MLCGTQTYTRIRGEFTVAHAHRACSLGDVARRDAIGVVLKATLSATEKPLRPTVAPLAVSAARTGAGRVARIDDHNCDTSKKSLVLQHLAKRGIRPEVVFVPRSLAFALRRASEVRKVLDGDGVSRLQGVHDPARDGMQRVANEAPLSTGEPIPEQLERPGAFGVELASNFATFGAVVEPFRLHLSAGVPPTVGESGDGRLSEIYADRLTTSRVLGNVRASGDVDVPLTVLAFDQLPALNALRVREEMPLVVADSKRQSTVSAAYGGEAYHFAFERKRASVVCHRAVLETARALALALRNTANSLYRKVRGKPEFGPEGVIAETVELEPSPLIMLSCYLQRSIAGIGKSCNRFLQRFYLTRRGLKFAFDRKYGMHVHHLITRGAVKRQVFLRSLKEAVSNPIAL